MPSLFEGVPTQSNDRSMTTTNTDNSTCSQCKRGAPTHSSQSTKTTNTGDSPASESSSTSSYSPASSSNGKTPLDEAFEKLGSDLRDNRLQAISKHHLTRRLKNLDPI